jgi:hypothetical protein
LLTPQSNRQTGGLPLLGYARLLIKCIRSYLSYLEVISSICNLRTRHNLITIDPFNVEFIPLAIKLAIAIFWTFSAHRKRKIPVKPFP